MDWAEIFLYCGVAAAAAFVLERLAFVLQRRMDADVDRFVVLCEAFQAQRNSLETLLSRKSVSRIMKNQLFELSAATVSQSASLQLAAWLDRGEIKPQELPCMKRLRREWDKIRREDKESAYEILAYVNRSSMIMLLLWNETLRSINWLLFEMTSEDVAAPLERAALIEEASAQAQAGRRVRNDNDLAPA